MDGWIDTYTVYLSTCLPACLPVCLLYAGEIGASGDILGGAIDHVHVLAVPVLAEPACACALCMGMCIRMCMGMGMGMCMRMGMCMCMRMGMRMCKMCTRTHAYARLDNL